MKKTRVIAAALMAAVISAGAGYAAWTDTLNINTTASTGTMNVEFTKGLLAPGKANLGTYVTSTLNQSAKVVDVTLSNMYPGSGLLYSLQFENLGSIPVTIDNVKIEWDNSNDPAFESLMKDKMVAVGGFVQTRPGRLLPVDGNILPTLNAIGQNKYHLKDLEKNLNDMLVNKTMQVGDKILFDIPQDYKDEIAGVLTNEGIEGFNPDEQNCLVMGLPLSADNNSMSKDLTTDLKVQKTLKFKIIINFKQFNK